MPTAAADRTHRLADHLRQQGADAFIAWSPVAMGYLHGFAEGAGERFMALCIRSDGALRLICPALSATQARRAGIEDVRPWRDGEDPLGHFQALASDWNLGEGTIGVDDELPAHMLLAMQAALPGARFRPGSRVLSELMRLKEPRELEEMRAAARIADEALATGLAALKPGITEAEVEEAITAAMRKLGGKPAFCIIAVGANGAEPHHLSDDTPIREGDVVVMDFGCTVNGYYSDITRMAAVGHASEEAKEVHRIVHRAFMAGRAAIRPGVPAQETDRAARRVIQEAGYGEFFMHRLGHGIGMKGHEEPNMVEGNTRPLEVGNCFSVEPGIYLPGKFGVRIENIVTVTPDGHASLNAEPPSELTVV